jgi:hypothetical protein
MYLSGGSGLSEASADAEKARSASYMYDPNNPVVTVGSSCLLNVYGHEPYLPASSNRNRAIDQTCSRSSPSRSRSRVESLAVSASRCSRLDCGGYRLHSQADGSAPDRGSVQHCRRHYESRLPQWRDGAARLCAGGDRTDPDRAMAYRLANPERIENQAQRLFLQFSRIPHTS